MEVKEITAEILEKNGFWRFAVGSYIIPSKSKENYTCVTPIKGLPNANGTWLVSIKNGYTDAKIAITYVHELQQALTLCGVEKTIEV
jgi:hypothetical protein